MNSIFSTTFDDYNSSSENILQRSISRQCDVSICEAPSGFQKLRISALTNAAQISPLVKKATIGPNSPLKKDKIIEEVEDIVVKDDIKNEENLLHDKLKEDLRYTLITKEYEAQFQQSSEILFRNSIEKIFNKRAGTMNGLFKKQSEHCERKAMEIRARKIQLQKEVQDNDNLYLLEMAKLDEQRSSTTVNRQTIDNMNRILEEENKAIARFAAITDSQTKIQLIYNDITYICTIEPMGKQICEKYMSQIKTEMGNISLIMDLCKYTSVTDNEVQEAEMICLDMYNIKNKIIEELNEIKQQELIQKQKEEELRRKELEKQKKEEELKVIEVPEVPSNVSLLLTATKPLFYSAKNYNYFKELSSFLNQYESQYKNLLEDAALKKFRFDCQKAVNTPINALSSVSGQHIRDKYEKLSKLLNGESVQVLDIYVKATQHPQGLPYCTALLAKKIVRQGELLVSSNPEAAFPLATITVALWSQFPEFGKLLEAYFVRQCPYLVPMYLPQQEGQTDKDFYISRGYTYTDGVVEKQDKFLKRMTGIFRLRCAIWVTKLPKFINACSPHGLKYGWQWLASFVNLKPEPDVSATLLHDFFTVCGSECNKLYGRQFTKVIELICTQYMPILQNIDEGGPKTRLEVFLQNVLISGQIAPPSGIVGNTW